MNASLPPRLLDAKAGAEYFSLPVATFKRLAVGRCNIGGCVRYDRFALDAYLDGESAVVANPDNGNDPEAALARFTQRQSNASRRP